MDLEEGEEEIELKKNLKKYVESFRRGGATVVAHRPPCRKPPTTVSSFSSDETFQEREQSFSLFL